ncbi:MAG: hypothetical protein SFW66_03295 [Gammaproteobacteria bacterium]|nr:hypothetical protein [Gammaproteobacteria bacterium]
MLKVKKNNLPLYILLGISVVPVILATLFYYGHRYFHFSQLNRGQLITPPMHLSDKAYASLNEKSAKRRWIVLQVIAGVCDQQCEHRDFLLHQVQKALGNNRDRIFIQQGKPSAFAAGHIYLVDPAQNVFMSYSDTTDPMNILQDLKRVLEVSQIG